MANTIRLRRGSTAPLAGSFVEGEPAWDSTNSKLYIKNAGGTMAQVGAPGGSNTYVQFNASGTFAGDIDFTYDTTNKVLDVNGSIYADGVVNVGATSRGIFSQGTLSFTGARLGGVFQSSQAQYYQVVLQNSSNNANASCDFVVCNDISTDTTTYGNFGINSSTYTGTGGLNAANATYVTSTTGPLVLGSTTAHDIRFVYNSETADALALSANDATFGKTIKPRAGTASANTAPLVFASGTNLTTAVAGALEYDGGVGYFTPDATIGRGFIPATQTFRLTGAGSAIGNTITNFFGTSSNIPLISGANYEIDIYMLALRGTTAGPATITLTNSAAPTLMFVDYEQSPLAGVAAPPGSVTALTNLYFRGTTTTTTAAYAITTGTLAISVNHYFRLKLLLRNGTGTSLKIQMTAGTGNNTMTPQAGSAWFCRRLPDANTGTFAA